MLRTSRVRFGMTLVELLVAISIVAILMSLTVVGISGAREAARRVQCVNRLRNLALAAVQHETGHNQYPGYLQKFGSWQPNSLLPQGPKLPALGERASVELSGVDPSDPFNTVAVPHEKIGTWAVALLPYLDAQSTYEIWADDQYPLISNHLPTFDHYNSLAVPNLDVFQCPSDPNDDGGNGRNSYVSNNGYVDPSGGVLPRAFAESMKRANGIFNNKYSGHDLLHDVAAAPVGPDVRAEHIRDGLSSTLLFSENLQADRWYRVGLEFAETQALIAPALHINASEARGYHGMVWQRYDDGGIASAAVPPQVAKINGAVGVDLPQQLFSFDEARPSSQHDEGVNAAFADGSVRFIAETVEYRVYQALLTPHGKRSDVPFPNYVLDADSL